MESSEKQQGIIPEPLGNLDSGLSIDPHESYGHNAKRVKTDDFEELGEDDMFSIDELSELDDSSESSMGVDLDMAREVPERVKNDFEEWVKEREAEGTSCQNILNSLGFYYLGSSLSEPAAKNILTYVVGYIKVCKDLLVSKAKMTGDSNENVDHDTSISNHVDLANGDIETEACKLETNEIKTEETTQTEVVNDLPLEVEKDVVGVVNASKEAVESSMDKEESEDSMDYNLDEEDSDDSSNDSTFTFPPRVEELVECDENFLITDPIDILFQLTNQLRLLNQLRKSRKKLDHINTIEDVVKCIEEAKNIIVLSGAGISVSCGIPDFRSPGGLYDQVREKYELSDPQYLFDIAYFTGNPNPFYDFSQQLFPDEKLKPSFSHWFIKLLEKKNKLLRNYSQNIDTLEQVSGISTEKIVLCHGSFATFSCLSCRNKVNGTELREEIQNKIIPRCKSCTDTEGYNNVMKPDIVFFGEPLPSEFKTTIIEDVKHCDLLIVMGSSLQVQPVALIPSLVVDTSPSIPQFLINRESVHIFHEFDYHFRSDCDEVVKEICRALGWEEELLDLSKSN